MTTTVIAARERLESFFVKCWGPQPAPIEPNADRIDLETFKRFLDEVVSAARCEERAEQRAP